MKSLVHRLSSLLTVTFRGSERTEKRRIEKAEKGKEDSERCPDLKYKKYNAGTRLTVFVEFFSLYLNTL